MKKFSILILSIVFISLLLSNKTMAASYTLEPITSKDSNIFLNKPTLVFRIGKDTQADHDRIHEELEKWSEDWISVDSKMADYIISIDYVFALVAKRIKTAKILGNAEDLSVTSYLVFFQDEYPDVGDPIMDPSTFKTPTMLTGSYFYEGVYDCSKITLINTVAEEKCSNNKFSAKLKFTTHIVDVSQLEAKIAEINQLINSETDEINRNKLIESRDKAQAILNNQNSIQTEVESGVDLINSTIKDLTAPKNQPSTDIKQEEKATEVQKTDQETQENTKISSPITGFINEKTSIFATLSAIILLMSATTYILIKK